MPKLTAQQCHEDFVAIANAIIALAQELADRFRLTVATPQGPETLSSIEPLAARFARAQSERAALIAQGLLTGDPTVRAWNSIKGNFLEGLALLACLHSSETAGRQILAVDVFGANAGIPIFKDDQQLFLWTQHSIANTQSRLHARPDIAYTNVSDLRPDTIVSIKECKHGGVGAKTIRAEFGKAYDLKVISYIVVSYFPLSHRLCDAARWFGLDVEALGLHTDQRFKFVAGDELGRDLVERIAAAERRTSFAERIQEIGRETQEKRAAIRRGRYFS